MGAGITLLREWAGTGTKIKPSDAQIDLGWVGGEQPPYEWENERMNTRDVRINQILTYLNAGVPLDDLIDGSASLTDASDITFTSGSTITTISSSGLDVSDTGDITVSIERRKISLTDASTGASDIEIHPKGVSFIGGYGDLQSARHRWECYNFANLTFSNPLVEFGALGDWWQLQESLGNSQNFVESNIPTAAEILGATITYTDLAGGDHTSPVHIVDKINNGGFWKFSIELISSQGAPDLNEYAQLNMHIDPFNVA